MACTVSRRRRTSRCISGARMGIMTTIGRRVRSRRWLLLFGRLVRGAGRGRLGRGISLVRRVFYRRACLRSSDCWFITRCTYDMTCKYHLLYMRSTLLYAQLEPMKTNQTPSALTALSQYPFLPSFASVPTHPLIYPLHPSSLPLCNACLTP